MSTEPSPSSSAQNTSGSPSPPTRRRRPRLGLPPASLTAGAPIRALARSLVRVDDVRNDLVSHHVALPEVDEGQTVDPGQDPLESAEAAAPTWHVDLGGVAGDDDLRAEADAGEEHLHLLRGRVLSLVEDD